MRAYEEELGAQVSFAVNGVHTNLSISRSIAENDDGQPYRPIARPVDAPRWKRSKWLRRVQRFANYTKCIGGM